MKIIIKTYLLVGILIALAILNLTLLFQFQQSGTAESYSIIRAGDLKVKTETVASLATSIASGNEADRENLNQEAKEFESDLNILRHGGSIRGQTIVTIPNEITSEYDDVSSSWQSYRTSAEQVEQTSVFDPEVINSLNYVLEKNGDMIITTNSLVNDLSDLDRNFNRHKEISLELHELSKEIGQQALLISIGEGEDIQEELRMNRLAFDIGLKKLLQIPVGGVYLEIIGEKNETLEPIPRENSESLRKLDPLWEAVQLRVKILEEKTLLSQEFGSAREELHDKGIVLNSSIDRLLDSWNEEINKGRSQEQLIPAGVAGIDIAVFFVVLYVIRQSLNPLQILTGALSRVKEGVYGEKINYTAKDEVGELVGSFNIMSDTIKVKEEEARKIDIAKDEFLAMITHELKTPLVPIRGYADLLLSEHLGKLTPKQKERLAIIKSSAGSLLDIISDLLDAQKLELGQLRMKKESHSINDTVTKAVEAFQPQADENEITITTSGPNVVMMHDSERIGQVLTNLIKNSLIAVQSKVGTIVIKTEDLPSDVRVSVEDNGIGIPTDKQKDLFKKFYQVDATLTRERGGSGLGLSICKGIVEGHGGKIEVQSTPNVGTTFSFTLPKEIASAM